MKIFLSVFLATVAMVSSQGYNYQQLPQQQAVQYQQPSQYYGQQPLVMQITPSIQLPSNSLNTPPVSVPAFLVQPQIKTQQPYRSPRPSVPRFKKPVVSKSFFIHSAPEETEEELQGELSQLTQQPRKHYNVLFIKSPSQTNKAAALNFANSLNEEKTVVYVLSKKTTAADLQDAVQNAPQKTIKPEVFFIKYRTPEEALNAQRQIQSQYDTLGGSSTISDEGFAQVTSVIGSLDPQVQEEEIAPSQNYEEVSDNSVSNNNGYLPPQY
ncbi:uncharacterized protein LOC129915070 [Episyrphus balteatus]|uniref:uncharacterized protein LOC129915070 n=1 Tax=Episyrphus balteatus TaxID=286459 RepID=UPI00248549D1|nr:uncharacterized protein LOC129915070 [Episyrphus balteatus]